MWFLLDCYPLHETKKFIWVAFHSILFLECASSSVVVETIPTNPLTCHLKSDCASVSCCLDETFIAKTFEVVFEIDDCEKKLFIGIEKLQFHVPLKDVEFGMFGFISLFLKLFLYWRLGEIINQGYWQSLTWLHRWYKALRLKVYISSALLLYKYLTIEVMDISSFQLLNLYWLVVTLKCQND